MGASFRTTTRISYGKIRSENKTLFEKNNDHVDRSNLPKKRVFISFHMENESQVNLLRHQAKSDKFRLEFIDYSVKAPFTGDWKRKCDVRLQQSSTIFVMIGKETYKRPAVLWEINRAYELRKEVIGVRIHKNREDHIPGPLLRNRAKIINWKMEDIQNALDKK